MERTEELENKKILPLILKYSLPAILGMLIAAIYNVVDRIFIGNSLQIGSIGIAAINITFPIYILQMAIASLVGAGGVVLFSIALGEKNKQKANQAFNTSFILLIIVAILFTSVFLIFLDSILSLFGTDIQLFQYAKEYIQVIIIGTIFQNIALGLNNFIRADGYPKTAMFSMIIGAIINIILDYIFIIIFKWGIASAAWATVIGQFCSAMFIIIKLSLNKENCKIKLFKTKLDINIIKTIFQYGLAAFIVQVGGMFLNIILNKKLIQYGGNLAVSGMGIINSLAQIVVLPVLGIMQGAQPIISYNYGAKNVKRSWDTLKVAVLMATLAMIVCFIITIISSKQTIELFTQDIRLIEFTQNALLIWFIALPIVGYQIIGASYFQAIGKYKISVGLHLLRQMIILTPMMIILGNFFQMNGVLASGPISDVISTIIITIALYIEKKKYKVI